MNKYKIHGYPETLSFASIEEAQRWARERNVTAVITTPEGPMTYWCSGDCEGHAEWHLAPTL